MDSSSTTSRPRKRFLQSRFSRPSTGFHGKESGGRGHSRGQGFQRGPSRRGSERPFHRTSIPADGSRPFHPRPFVPHTGSPSTDLSYSSATRTISQISTRDVPALEQAVQRIKDTFIPGIDDEKQLPLEKEIVYEIYASGQKQLGFDALHARLYEKGLIRTTELLKEAISRLTEIGVILQTGETYRIAPQFER